MSIYIFSRPVHSGKTTRLMNWCFGRENIAGILMPDMEGSRKMMDLQTKESFDIECKGTSKRNEELISVGRFHFYSSVFEKGNLIISRALSQSPVWLIIDEAGKLELEGRGFYPGVLQAVNHFQSGKAAGNLIITVRENLCEEVIAFFKIKNAIVVHTLDM